MCVCLPASFCLPQVESSFCVKMSSDAEHCPGVDSDQAGKASACDGCPNKGICSSGELKSQDDQKDKVDIARKLSTVKNIILVMSGKGGVGKSTVSSQLARYIAQSNVDINVGLLDIDICGPSIPKAMGIENSEIFMSASGWSPVYTEDNLAVMSCGFLLDSLDDAVIWRGPKKNGIIKQFLRDVDWSDLDYLIIDTPPGTSDEHISIVNYLKLCPNLKGAILVTTPQEIAQMDVRKQLDFCKRVNLKVLGIVENMAVFTCPKCNKDSFIFKRSSNNTEDLLKKIETTILGQIPLDPMIGKSCDEGQSLFADDQVNSRTKEAFEKIWTNVSSKLSNQS